MAVPAEKAIRDAQINPWRKDASRDRRCRPPCNRFAAEVPGRTPVAAI